MIIDVNASIGRSLYSKALGLADLLSEMKRLKITRAVVSPLLPPSFNFDQANRQLAEIVSQHPRKLIGLGRVDPRLGRKALRYAHNAIEQYRLHGLKLHPWEEHYPINHPMVYPVMDYAQEARVPVLIAGGYPTVSHALQILELAQAYPQVKMVVTHCAQLDISGLSIGDAMILAQETEQVYFETSGVYRRDLIEGLVNDVGAHRLVFGSNFPDMNIEMELERIYAADLPDEAKAQLLGENARGIFK